MTPEDIVLTGIGWTHNNKRVILHQVPNTVKSKRKKVVSRGRGTGKCEVGFGVFKFL